MTARYLERRGRRGRPSGPAWDRDSSPHRGLGYGVTDTNPLSQKRDAAVTEAGRARERPDREDRTVGLETQTGQEGRELEGAKRPIGLPLSRVEVGARVRECSDG